MVEILITAKGKCGKMLGLKVTIVSELDGVSAGLVDNLSKTKQDMDMCTYLPSLRQFCCIHLACDSFFCCKTNVHQLPFGCDINLLGLMVPLRLHSGFSRKFRVEGEIIQVGGKILTLKARSAFHAA